MADRGALQIGTRVQLSWVKYAPYTQRADLSVADRLAVVIGRDGDAWLVRDDTGEMHRLTSDALDEEKDDPAVGRWRIEGAIPAYAIGERLRLHWRYRGMVDPVLPRDDRDATVVAEDADHVTARFDDGEEIRLYRWGGQDERDRAAPRWFVVGRAAPATG